MMGFLHKVKGSLAFRLPHLYRRLLRLKHINDLPPKRPLDLMVIMMTGRNFIDMTRFAVLSIAKSWSAVPKLIINTDGSIPAADVIKQLRFWPGELVVEDWQNTAAYHQHKSRPALVKYGNAHPFGKKLALILRYAEQAPVFWLDSDILFFNDFIPYLPKPASAFACGGAEDFTPAYHEAVIKHTGNNLYQQYLFNAGLLYVHGKDIYENFNLDKLIEAIHPDYDFCTEQTIFAHLASKSLGIIWSKDIVKTFNADSQDIKAMPVKNVIARHYTSNVRHLFWRDAFFN